MRHERRRIRGARAAGWGGLLVLAGVLGAQEAQDSRSGTSGTTSVRIERATLLREGEGDGFVLDVGLGETARVPLLAADGLDPAKLDASLGRLVTVEGQPVATEGGVVGLAARSVWPSLAEVRPLTITVTARSTVIVQGKELPMPHVEAVLRGAAERAGSGFALEIRVEGRVPFEELLPLLQVTERLGAARVDFELL